MLCICICDALLVLFYFMCIFDKLFTDVLWWQTFCVSWHKMYVHLCILPDIGTVDIFFVIWLRVETHFPLWPMIDKKNTMIVLLFSKHSCLTLKWGLKWIKCQPLISPNQAQFCTLLSGMWTICSSSVKYIKAVVCSFKIFQLCILFVFFWSLMSLPNFVDWPR